MSYSSGTATSTGDEPYWLGRASEEQQCLVEQHGIYINCKLPDNTKIADIATGTAIPRTGLATSNVKPAFLDFKKPIPEDLRGKFDLVDIRLIISLGSISFWESALKNILTFLKPCGAITWTECDFWVARGFPGGFFLNTSPTKRFGYSSPDFKDLFGGAVLKGVHMVVINWRWRGSRRTEEYG
ncbi:uncharacterized protein K460DRAFT_379787 [Cucurbitaria berberidis CBS 394.84]|uniref:Uncharacterized protein n=1 Tax=Cucurbitaria berberidis CBS 394.84 TaxID=1168544 RepID=A0A9P4GAB9_9PLEO|nr:uncharacterized protein K460DRAFT_379787 [Cucurbitaria berberidis CBS 394.84]KAF1841782.1 hypothetical protein K460DRAFT_379787 [Cucurbitaria berberidis CBS 394.84]